MWLPLSLKINWLSMALVQTWSSWAPMWLGFPTVSTVPKFTGDTVAKMGLWTRYWILRLVRKVSPNRQIRQDQWHQKCSIPIIDPPITMMTTTTMWSAPNLNAWGLVGACVIDVSIYLCSLLCIYLNLNTFIHFLA